jgi:haloalkane dehalogenase
VRSRKARSSRCADRSCGGDRKAPERGPRGVAFDLPGLGLAAKPPVFDYSWSRLGRWTGEAIDALGIERCHLLLHDIGGPIALEWALRNRDRVRTLTVLDTLIDVAHFRRVWTMELAAPPVIGPLWVAGIRPPVGRWLFCLQGIGDRSATPAHEVDAHIALLHTDGGASTFRKIVRGFELTGEKERFYTDGLREAAWPTRSPGWRALPSRLESGGVRPAARAAAWLPPR